MRPNPLIATFTAIVLFCIFGGNNFLKPMRDFSLERPPVNEEFGNNLAKTSPLFAAGGRSFPPKPAINGQSFCNLWLDACVICE
jgi:hypothetical protein